MRAVTRSRSCSAALREKVSARIESGATPSRSIRAAIASTSVVVLPVPGPARTSNGPSVWSTTCCWNSSSWIAGPDAATGRTSWYVVAGRSEIGMRPANQTAPTPESGLPEGVLQVDGSGGTHRRTFLQIALASLSLMARRERSISAYDAPPRHRTAVNGHHRTHLPRAASAVEPFGDHVRDRAVRRDPSPWDPLDGGQHRLGVLLGIDARHAPEVTRRRR